MQRKVSLIVPVYNEAGAIEPFVSAVEAVTTTLDAELDIIFVDDGSRDTTCDEIVAAAKSHSILIQLLALSRNFGKEAAITAGIDAAAGDAVIPIDVDLQHPPEIIPLFIEEWCRGAKVVYGKRLDRDAETWLKRVTSRVFYRIFNALSQSDIPPDAGDFRLMDRSVVAALANYRERNSVHEGSVFGGRIQDCACRLRGAGPSGRRNQMELLAIVEFRTGWESSASRRSRSAFGPTLAR